MSRRARIINPPQDLKRRAISATKGLNIDLTPEEIAKIETAVHKSKDKFVSQIAEKLKALRVTHHDVEKAPELQGAYLAQLRDESLAIKGLAGTFGFHLITTMATSLNDYVLKRAEASARQLIVIRLHIDMLYVLLSRAQQPGGGMRAETEGELLASFKILTAKYA
jgi:chemotaxis protein histidine kinase CheA